MCNISCSIFCNFELSTIQKLEEISAWAIFKDNINVVRVLKHIYHPDDIWMLAYFKYLNLTFLEF
jgi:hypothetical protein